MRITIIISLLIKKRVGHDIDYRLTILWGVGGGGGGGMLGFPFDAMFGS